LVEGFGGKCNKCGYNRCYAALDFHHIDETQKNFGISEALAKPKRWAILVEEAKKCVMLCKVCHVELHEGIWSLSEIDLFEFNYEEQKSQKEIPTGECPVCGKEVFLGNITCSRRCAAKKRNKIEWPDNSQLLKMLEEGSFASVATELGISDAAIRKRLKKYGAV